MREIIEHVFGNPEFEIRPSQIKPNLEPEPASPPDARIELCYKDFKAEEIALSVWFTPNGESKAAKKLRELLNKPHQTSEEIMNKAKKEYEREISEQLKERFEQIKDVRVSLGAIPLHRFKQWAVLHVTKEYDWKKWSEERGQIITEAEKYRIPYSFG